MFFQIKDYLLFLLKSNTKYGVHSPFVYNLIIDCFEKGLTNEKINILKEYQSELTLDKTILNVKDLGAGSRVFKSNKRKVSAIYKNAGISTKNAVLLLKIVQYFKSVNILEIGTSLGFGSLSLSLGNENSKITTLEGCPETLNVAKKYLSKFKVNNMNFVLGNFDQTLKTVLDKKYDLIYFDGNHQKEPTINYFEQCLKTIHNESVFIFDDIHWSKGMSEAWDYIKNHKKVTLTIDIFYWGIVFFREEQFEKEHFILKV